MTVLMTCNNNNRALCPYCSSKVMDNDEVSKRLWLPSNQQLVDISMIIILAIATLARESVRLCRGMNAQSMSPSADVRTRYHIHLGASYNYYLSLNHGRIAKTHGLALRSRTMLR